VLRWGVLAPGRIAANWVGTVHANTDQKVVAVASRTLSRAQEFATANHIDRAYGSYEQLVSDPEVDIVYVAAPHNFHAELALLAIEAGKHVLIEKPIATTTADARAIRDAAKTAGVFAMEALWSRYLPQSSVIAQLLADGALGDVSFAGADFGFAAPIDLEGRMYSPDLAGGALLDLGVYTSWFAHFVMGAPATISAVGSLAVTGVDAQSIVTLGYAGTAQAVVTSSMISDIGRSGVIGGTQGRIEFADSFMSPSSFSFSQGDRDPLVFPVPELLWHGGLCYQATAAAQYVSEGRLDSPLHSLEDSIAVLTVLETARAQLGVE
jgi:predicted dehydrogenase